jgi:flavin-dependent dehydrogenase
VRRGDGLHVRVGVMSSRDAAHYFEQLLSIITPRWGVRGHPPQRPRQKILPLSPIPKTFAERLLVLGDAAGLVKPTTGGGIYYSLVSAAIAADVLAEALQRNQFGHRALSAYEVRWRERLSAELARTDGIMPIVRRTARFNRHRDLIVALFKHPPVRRIMFRALAG